jgi:hypothetical protein
MSGAEEEEQVYTRVRLEDLMEKLPEGMRELIETSEDNNNEHRKWRSWGIYDESEGRNNRSQYRKRWAIEEKYDRLKNELKFESGTGKASV